MTSSTTYRCNRQFSGPNFCDSVSTTTISPVLFLALSWYACSARATTAPRPSFFRLDLTIFRPVRWPCSRHLRLTGRGAWYLAPTSLLLLESLPRRGSSGCRSCSTLHILSFLASSTGFRCLLASAGHG